MVYLRKPRAALSLIVSGMAGCTLQERCAFRVLFSHYAESTRDLFDLLMLLKGISIALADTDVLITHRPPKSIGDEADMGFGSQNVGCIDLLYRIDQLKLKAHIFAPHSLGV